MAKLRHIAISVPDPWKAADFYMEAFGMTKVGEAKAPAADGVYLSDGTINLALLRYKEDEWVGEGKTKDWFGVHHIGFITDDAEALGKRIKEKGGQFKGASPSPEGRNAEDKYTDPEGIVFDVSQHGWLGTS